jgi:hypothetical protein
LFPDYIETFCAFGCLYNSNKKSGEFKMIRLSTFTLAASVAVLALGTTSIQAQTTSGSSGSVGGSAGVSGSVGVGSTGAIGSSNTSVRAGTAGSGASSTGGTTTGIGIDSSSVTGSTYTGATGNTTAAGNSTTGTNTSINRTGSTTTRNVTGTNTTSGINATGNTRMDFTGADTDRSGSISQSEFSSSMDADTSIDTFNEYDTDGDGMLNDTEYQGYFNSGVDTSVQTR